MNRLLLWFVFVAVAFYTTVLNSETKCVEKQKCPDGVKTGCCQPPPCEFYEQLNSKRAMQRLFANKKARAWAKKKAGGDNKESAKLFYDFVLYKVGKMNRKSKCKKKFVDFPPSFETDEGCRIVAKLDEGEVPKSREQAHKDFETCSEFIDAIYDHEQYHKDVCNRTNSTERINQGVESYATEEVNGYQKEIDALKADLQSYWRACSPTADANSARKIANQGISTLKSKMKGKKSPAKAGK